MHLTNFNRSSHMFILRSSTALAPCKQHPCDLENTPVTAVCPLTDWRVKAEHTESVLSQRGTNSRTRGASVCSHLSTDSRVITGRSAQIRAHKHTHTHPRWNKQLASELTTLALILTESIRCGVSQRWVGRATVTESTAGEAWKYQAIFRSLIYN